jgi:hypothetical protein
MSDDTFKHCRFATEENIAMMSNNFTLPARLAKASDWQKQQSQQQAHGLSEQASERLKYHPPSKP